MYHSPRAAAAILGISVNSVRGQCTMFKEFLSADAAPASGAERRLTQLDVAILQRVRELRGQGMDTTGIKATLQAEDLTALQPAYIDVVSTIDPHATPEPPAPAPVATLGGDLVQAIQALADDRHALLLQRVADMEGRQKDRLTWFVLGLLCGAVIVGVVVAIILLGGSLR